jgi:uroporphyrinogen-III synthase
MRVLITRPNEDAARFAELVRARGHEAVCASLLSVNFFDGPELTLDGVSAVVATSANGVRAFVRRSERRDLPLFAVGPQTADAARAAGFEHIECADGDAATLAAAVPDWIKAEEGVLLHAASVDNEGRAKALLAEEGFSVHVEVLYEVVPLHKLPEAVRERLAHAAIDALVVFSPRSAMTLRDCIVRARLSSVCRQMVAVCISQATAEALAPLEFGQVAVAARPNQDALLDCLDILTPGG